MTAWSTLLLSLLPALAVVQTPELAQPGVLEELKAVRATLERLERSQQALVALTRLQIGESRLAAFEARRQNLLAEERDLNQQLSRLARPTDPTGGGAVTRLVQVGPPGSATQVETTTTAEVETSTAVAVRTRQRLQEVQSELRTTEQSMAAVRTEIAAWEKHFADAVR